jgi:hypothetical protein
MTRKHFTQSGSKWAKQAFADALPRRFTTSAPGNLQKISLVIEGRVPIGTASRALRNSSSRSRTSSRCSLPNAAADTS